MNVSIRTVPNCSDREHPWALLLAGGDGTRLRSLIFQDCGRFQTQAVLPLFGSTSLLGKHENSCGPVLRRDARDAHEGFYREDLSDVDDSAYLEGAQEAETQSKEYGGNQGVDPWAAGKLHNAKDLEINHDEAQNREQHDNPRTEEQRLR